MSRQLQATANWPERAAGVHWCVATLAKQLHVSVSTLERFFHEAMKQCPREWINAERMRRARELLCDHSSVKETAMLLCYQSQHSFSLAFKKYHGYPPCGRLKKIQDGGVQAAKQTPE